MLISTCPTRQLYKHLLVLGDISLCSVKQMLFYFQNRTTIQTLCIWFLFNTTACFGCLLQLSSGIKKYWFTKRASSFSEPVFLPDDDWSRQPKHVVVLYKYQIYKICIVVCSESKINSSSSPSLYATNILLAQTGVLLPTQPFQCSWT
jgi:hypothetical protein